MKYFFNQDHLGNTRVVYRMKYESNQMTYNLQGAYDYFPYSKLLRKFVPGNGIEKYLSTQHERDEETISDDNNGTGLDYRINRYYDSDVIRFNSVDKLANHPNQIDKSPYSYVWGNPIKLTDPDGNCPECPNAIRDLLVGLQIKWDNWNYEPSGDAPSSEGGYTATTNNPTNDGTTDNASRKTTGGAEMLNIDPIYSFMSSTSTMSNGTKVLSSHKVFEKIHAITEGVNTVLTAESKAQEININVEEYKADAVKTLYYTNGTTGDTIGAVNVSWDDPWNSTGQGDTLWGFGK